MRLVFLSVMVLTGCFDFGAGSGGTGGGTGGAGGGGASDGYLAVYAGSSDSGFVSGVVRLSVDGGSLAGSLTAKLNGTSFTDPFTGTLTSTTDAGDRSFNLIGPNITGNCQIISPETATASGNAAYSNKVLGFINASQGTSGRFSATPNNATSKLYCGTFSGPAAGVWNFVISSGELIGAFSGATTDSNPSTTEGNLAGTATGSTVSLRWQAFFIGGTASGTISGSTVSGTWFGYLDGGTWTSGQTCGN